MPPRRNGVINEAQPLSGSPFGAPLPAPFGGNLASAVRFRCFARIALELVG